MDKKKCTRCSLEKDVTQFYTIKYKRFSVIRTTKSSLCIDCSRKVALSRARGISVSSNIPPIENISGEIWKPVVGYETFFEVSNFGRVKSLNYRDSGRCYLVSPIKNEQGYVRYSLQVKGQRKTIFGHVLVAKAFIENPYGKPQVNHVDGVKNNNHISNLEWVTAKENMQHAHDTGLMPRTGRKKPVAYGPKRALLKPVIKIDDNNNIVDRYDSLAQAEIDGFSASKISAVCQGKRYYHRGFKWKYANEHEQSENTY